MSDAFSPSRSVGTNGSTRKIRARTARATAIPVASAQSFRPVATAAASSPQNGTVTQVMMLLSLLVLPTA